MWYFPLTINFQVKFKLILITFIAFSFNAYSQSKNQISVLYGASATSVNIHGAIGDYGYNNKSGSLYGFTYTRSITGSFSIETGIIAGNDKVQLNSDQPGPYQGKHDGEVKVVSVPIIGKFTFVRFLFVDGGISLDKQTNYYNNSVLDDQSGLGAEAGIGGKIRLGPVSFFVNPYLRGYVITRTRNNLMETGVKFGLGYNF